ncbi:unnamed protein product [Soboliphyme baturini]|uniref:Uncharacterized protein n=1 Tax=Soboliphyme baturini TaxID=241478 RepID=A0A183IDF3_9BILA|nr:unnamed protein product [Soboliphyme baturini]
MSGEGKLDELIYKARHYKLDILAATEADFSGKRTQYLQDGWSCLRPGHAVDYAVQMSSQAQGRRHFLASDRFVLLRIHNDGDNDCRNAVRIKSESLSPSPYSDGVAPRPHSPRCGRRSLTHRSLLSSFAPSILLAALLSCCDSSVVLNPNGRGAAWRVASEEEAEAEEEAQGSISEIICYLILVSRRCTPRLVSVDGRRSAAAARAWYSST